jgi:Holliday junction resolvase RusA-like endonuclease
MMPRKKPAPLGTLVVDWTGKAVGVNAKDGVGKYGQRYTTSAYKAFVVSMAWTIRAQAHRFTFPGRINVDLELEIPARMDIDAVVKPCYDALQMSGIVVDDNLIRHGSQGRTGRAHGLSKIRFIITEA